MTEQPSEDPIGRQLVRQAEVISQLRKDVDRLATDVTDTLTDVLSRIDSIEAGSGGGPDSVTAWC